MRTIRTKLYKFAELSEISKQKVIQSLSDINVDCEWWDYIYEDALRIGLKITGFDIDRGNYCSGDLLDSMIEVCAKIFENHGETCETYKTAQSFLKKWAQLVAEHSDGLQKDKVCEDKEHEFDQLADELKDQFLICLCNDYRIMLQKEYEYLTSEMAIIETIEANDYEFTQDGKMF